MKVRSKGDKLRVSYSRKSRQGYNEAEISNLNLGTLTLIVTYNNIF